MTGHDLFSAGPGQETSESAGPDASFAARQPLAARMRPRNLDEMAGQRHILAPGRFLRRAIEADRIQSLIFYGPPGTGKTSLAQVIARQTRSKFERLSGAESNVADMRRVLAGAANRLENTGQSTILFVDEIHRFNQAQQDVLLPDVESGLVRLIGATTHNPFFFVNSPLVSRSQIFELEPLGEEDLLELLRRALADGERGLGHLKIRADEAALRHLAKIADGDARKALNSLEIAAITTPPQADGFIVIDLAVAEACIQKKAVVYDGDGDAHYDTISAFIKSMRGGRSGRGAVLAGENDPRGGGPAVYHPAHFDLRGGGRRAGRPDGAGAGGGGAYGGGIHRLAGSADSHRGGGGLYCHGEQEQQRVRGD